MAYADVAAVLADETLTDRVKGCVLEQASLKDVTTDPLARYALAQPDPVAAEFMYFVGGDAALVGKHASGGQSAISDGDILAKVQAEWADVTDVLNLGAAA